MVVGEVAEVRNGETVNFSGFKPETLSGIALDCRVSLRQVFSANPNNDRAQKALELLDRLETPEGTIDTDTIVSYLFWAVAAEARINPGSVFYSIPDNRQAPSKWLVAHQDFFNQQGMVLGPKPENANDEDFYEINFEDQVWGPARAEKLLFRYLAEFSSLRKEHKKIYLQALERLSDADQKVIEYIYRQSPYPENQQFMVAIPSPRDNPAIYAYLGLTVEQMRLISAPWAKIWEHGIIYSSRNYRSGNGGGDPYHDYFRYLLGISPTQQTGDIWSTMSSTLRHEARGHGQIGFILVTLLSLKDHINPVYEGLAGALGGDGRENQKSLVTMAEFINNPYQPEKPDLQYQINYIMAPRFFRLILNHQGDRPEAVAKLFKLGLRLKDDPQYQAKSEVEKTEQVVVEIMKDFSLNTEQLRAMDEKFASFGSMRE